MRQEDTNHRGLSRTILRSILRKTLKTPATREVFRATTRTPLLPASAKHRLKRAARNTIIEHPGLAKGFRTGRALILYHTTTGNTEKVARAIEKAVRETGMEPTTRKITRAQKEDLYDYDLVCLGTPVIHSLPTAPINRYIQKKGEEYRRRKEVRLPAHQVPGKEAIVFVTYSGPHIGVGEALPAGKYLRQFLEHLGFKVLDEQYVVGEFHTWRKASVNGYLGDIRGRPSQEDLAQVEQRTKKTLQHQAKTDCPG